MSNDIETVYKFRFFISKMKRNISYTKKRELIELEHIHFYYSHDQNLEPNIYSSVVGGHFHEVTLIEKAGKKPKIKISRPLMKDSKGNVCAIKYDTHKHRTKYIGSEMLRPYAIKLKWMDLYL